MTVFSAQLIFRNLGSNVILIINNILFAFCLFVCFSCAWLEVALLSTVNHQIIIRLGGWGN